MLLELPRTRHYLREFDFKSLFLDQLGWDRHVEHIKVPIGSHVFTLTAIAQKREMVAFLCAPLPGGAIPGYNMRRRIERKLAKFVREHLILYVDAGRTVQVWQVAKGEVGKPIASPEHIYTPNQTGDSLIQKLQGIVFSIEEEHITRFDVTSRARSAFDIEPVTKKFYDRFKVEQAAFLKHLENAIPDMRHRRWYASVMLNRLMFLYFLQWKNFLNGDRNYLSNKLRWSKDEKKDNFYTGFLLALFFEGVAKRPRDRSSEVNEMLGSIPYLNGSLFARHRVEELYGQAIHIPDVAFERLFEFFNAYRWHLDERPLRADNEINPDVLGYIFEKYINEKQKQMGAYYSKEDITEYLAKNTVIPSLFNMAQREYATSYRLEMEIWRLLREDPDRYISSNVRKGMELLLPDEVAVGLSNPHQRAEWNKAALEEYALVDESWREVIIRRERYEEVRQHLERGEIHHIDDLITYNLDIIQFIEDVIENCEGPELLRAFYGALKNLSVLDPTCGSGAFLFAALNILEPLYDACLSRMQSFLDESEVLGRKRHADTYSDFRTVLKLMNMHPNRRYFILKSIILNNLYGIDIMEEAMEICKLRLFLKLAAPLEDIQDIEPLPDIDFNIRAGNALVGFANYNELRNALSSKFGIDNLLEQQIEESARETDQAYKNFRDMQTNQDTDPRRLVLLKQQLTEKLDTLRKKVDHSLADVYHMGLSKDKHAFSAWHESHLPFHWFIEFYGIMTHGGFSAIVGNPPYVEYSKVKADYTIPKGKYSTASCGNVYAFVMERNESLLSHEGRSGMIVPHSAFCTDRMMPILKLVRTRSSWISTYSIRPAKIFSGVDQRLAIYLLGNRETRYRYATRYHCWNEEFRPFLMENLRYTSIKNYTIDSSYPKVSTYLEESIWKKVQAFRPLSLSLMGDTVIYYHNAPRYWIRAMTFAPYFWNERGGEQISSHVKMLRLGNKGDADVVAAALNSSLFFWWFILLSNCRDLTVREIETFPLGIATIAPSHKEALIALLERLMEDYQKHAIRKEALYKATGKVVYDEYYPKHSKSLIDEIDLVLAQHFGFTHEEVDFILNYEIKYRMGRDTEGDK